MNIGIGIGLCMLQGGGSGAPPSVGALEIDTFQVLIDGFPVIFS